MEVTIEGTNVTSTDGQVTTDQRERADLQSLLALPAERGRLCIIGGNRNALKRKVAVAQPTRNCRFKLRLFNLHSGPSWKHSQTLRPNSKHDSINETGRTRVGKHWKI